MKKLMLGILLSFFTLTICGQSVLKLRATDFCYQTKDYYGYWTNWSKWQSTNILIVINLNTLRITIYSEYTQEYDIIEYYDERVDSNGDFVSEFRAIDQDNVRCGIRFVDKAGYDESHLYIDYSNMRWAYNVYSIN